MRNKIQQEKRMRDKQLSEENKRKSGEEKRQKEMEYRTVRRLQEELENERQQTENKRIEERDYMERMFKENEDNK